MALGIFYRGNREVFRQEMERRPPPTYCVRYSQPFGIQGSYDPQATLECWQEVFERNVNFNCPNCKCLVYNSTNWHEALEWLYKKLCKQGFVNYEID